MPGRPDGHDQFAHFGHARLDAVQRHTDTQRRPELQPARGHHARGHDVLAPMAFNPTTGLRRSPARPDQTTTWTLENLCRQTYYWSVQAVDTALGGRPSPPRTASRRSLPTSARAYRRERRCSVAWGDYDNDGDLDVLLTGPSGGVASRVYRNNGGTFSDIGAGLPGVSISSVAWGDYDNDGDLDILLTGSSSTP